MLTKLTMRYFCPPLYELKAIYDAASYVLACTAATALKQLQGTPNPHSTPNASDPTAATIEALTLVIFSLSSMVILVTTLQMQQVQTDPQGIGAVPVGLNMSDSSLCSFCGMLGHFICKCRAMEESIQAGKCKWNQKGKIVLPFGTWVSCSIPGPWLYNQIEEYH